MMRGKQREPCTEKCPRFLCRPFEDIIAPKCWRVGCVIRTASPRFLARPLGRAGLRSYRQWHRRRRCSTSVKRARRRDSHHSEVPYFWSFHAPKSTAWGWRAKKAELSTLVLGLLREQFFAKTVEALQCEETDWIDQLPGNESSPSQLLEQQEM